MLSKESLESEGKTIDDTSGGHVPLQISALMVGHGAAARPDPMPGSNGGGSAELCPTPVSTYVSPMGKTQVIHHWHIIEHRSM